MQAIRLKVNPGEYFNKASYFLVNLLHVKFRVALIVSNYKVKRSFNKGSEKPEKFTKSSCVLCSKTQTNKQTSNNNVQRAAKCNRFDMAKVQISENITNYINQARKSWSHCIIVHVQLLTVWVDEQLMNLSWFVTNPKSINQITLICVLVSSTMIFIHFSWTVLKLR